MTLSTPQRKQLPFLLPSPSIGENPLQNHLTAIPLRTFGTSWRSTFFLSRLHACLIRSRHFFHIPSNTCRHFQYCGNSDRIIFLRRTSHLVGSPGSSRVPPGVHLTITSILNTASLANFTLKVCMLPSLEPFLSSLHTSLEKLEWAKVGLMMSGIDTQGGRCPTVITPISHQSIHGIMNNKQYWCCLVNSLVSRPQTDITRKGFKIVC